MKITNNIREGMVHFKLSILVKLFMLAIAIIFLMACDNTSTKGSISQQGNKVVISGEVEINQDLNIKDDHVLIIEPGSILKFGDDIQIKVKGKILAKGTQENPIVFQSIGENVFWRGIEIENLNDIPDIDRFWEWIESGNKETEDYFFEQIEKGNIFEYCNFKDLATKSRDFKRKNKWKGTIEAYNTSLRVSHCTFRNVLYFGGVLTQRSYVIVNDCNFDDETIHKGINSTDRAVGLFCNNYIEGHRDYNTRCADGIWTKQFVGLISNNTIISTGDDGIDLDGSRAMIFNNKITGVMDDGIDVDNKGLCYLVDNTVDGANENGILVSDESKAICIRNKISNSVNGIALRDGVEVVSEEMDIRNNVNGVILFQNIPGLITLNDFENIKAKVNGLNVDEIYEAEYISGIESPEDVISILDNYYSQNGQYWEFNNNDYEEVSELDDLKKVFKLIGVLDLEYIAPEKSASTNAAKLSAKLKNGIFISAAVIKDNEEDIALYHDYNIRIEDSEFTSEAGEKEILDNCQCDENHKCDIIDKLNTSAIEINGKKLMKRIDTL